MLNPPTVQGRSFRRLLLRRVVDNLLRAKSVPWSSIEKIFSKCPSIWSNGEISSKGVLLHQLFIDEREAEYLLALANVAVSIRQHQDRLWGFLRRLVRSLPNILEVASNIRPLTTEILTILLASEVRYNQGDANHQEALSRMRELLVADILSVLQQTINSCFAGQPFLARSIPLIIGLLEGLSQSKTSLCEVAPTQTDLLLELGNQLLSIVNTNICIELTEGTRRQLLPYVFGYMAALPSGFSDTIPKASGNGLLMDEWFQIGISAVKDVPLKLNALLLVVNFGIYSEKHWATVASKIEDLLSKELEQLKTQPNGYLGHIASSLKSLLAAIEHFVGQSPLSSIPESMTVLASYAQSIYQVLMDAFEDLRLVNQIGSSALLTALQQALCVILKCQARVTGFPQSAARPILSALAAKLARARVSRRFEQSSIFSQGEFLATLLGDLALALASEGLVEAPAFVVPLLLEVVGGTQLLLGHGHNESVLHSAWGSAPLVHQLGRVAVACPSVSEGILSVFLDIYARALVDDHSRSIADPIPAGLLYIAKGLKLGGEENMTKVFSLCQQLLHLFVQLCVQISSNIQHSNSTGLSKMGMIPGALISCLAELATEELVNTKDNQTITVLRHTWFFIALFKYDEPNLWSEQWLDSLKKLARRSPSVLADRGGASYGHLEVELQTTIVLKTKPSDEHLNDIKALLPDSSTKKLSSHLLMFLGSLLKLECLRARELECRVIFSYLTNPGVLSSELIEEMGLICTKVFRDFLTACLMNITSDRCIRALETHLIFLIRLCAHRYSQVRECALRCVKKVLDEHQDVLWWNKPLFSLLNLLQDVTWVIDQGPLLPEWEDYNTKDKTPVQPELGACNVDLPPDKVYRSHVLRDLYELCYRWTVRIIDMSPHLSNALFQSYKMTIKETTKHAGTELIREVATYGQPMAHKTSLEELSCSERAEAAAKVAPPRLLHFGKVPERALPNKETFARGLTIKSQYVGEITGMCSFLQSSMPMQGAEIWTEVKKTLMKSFGNSVPLKSASDEKIVITLLYQSSAALVCTLQQMEKQAFHRSSIQIQDTKLVHLIYWVPALILTETVMEAALFCWRWLWAAVPQLRPWLMNECAGAWVWTVLRCKGLFSGLPNSQGAPHAQPPPSIFDCQNVSMFGQVKGSDGHIDPKVQDLWFQFILDCRSTLITDYSWPLYQVFAVSLQDHRMISQRLDYFGLSISLLSSALEIAQESYKTEVDETPVELYQKMMRKGIYKCLLHLFNHQNEMILEASVGAIKVQQDFESLRIFGEALRKEKKLLKATLKRRSQESEEMPQIGALRSRGNQNSFKVHPMPSNSSPPSLSITPPLDSNSNRAVIKNSPQGKFEALKIAFDDFLNEERIASIERETTDNISDLLSEARLLLFLIGHELDKMTAFHRDKLDARGLSLEDRTNMEFKMKSQKLQMHVTTAWNFSPSLALALASRFPESKVISKALQEKVFNDTQRASLFSHAVPFFILKVFLCQSSAVKQKELLQALVHWAPCSVPVALRLVGRCQGPSLPPEPGQEDEMMEDEVLGSPSPSSPASTSFTTSPPSPSHVILFYAVRALTHHPVEVIKFYLLQLVQLLRQDRRCMLEDFLFKMSQTSIHFSHQLLWTLQAESKTDHDGPRHGFQMQISGHDLLPAIAISLMDRITGFFTGETRTIYEKQFSFFEAVISISAELKDFPNKELQKSFLKEQLAKLPKPLPAYLPTNPDGKLVDMDILSAEVMPYATKCPFLLSFKIEQDQGAPLPTRSSKEQNLDQSDGLGKKISITVQPCLFKVYDDCRQDAMVVQIICLFKQCFESVGVDLKLFPYGVIPTRAGKNNALGGMVGCVPNCHSRDAIGKGGAKHLLQYFTNQFGAPGSLSFQVAQHKFASSLAGYAIVCFILQIKDRHNGNLLIDNQGHVIHIDFGFLLGISPGGNLGFETAAFKFTKEMMDILGGHPDAEPFRFFVDLCIKGFLASRQLMEPVLAIVSGMADSGLPCYCFPETLQKLRSRFAPELSPQKAGLFMKNIVFDAVKKWTTTVYDGIQRLQNNIHS